METKLIIGQEKDFEEIVLRALTEFDNRKSQVEKERKENETLFTINQVAKRLKRSHASIKKLVQAEILKTTPDGRISEKSINDYLRNS